MSETTKTYTVIDTETQKSVTFESTATTIAELKNEILQQGIDPEGKVIQEGITRVEFKDDSAILPTNVPYKGTTTNNLVFRLTKANKQVRSGAMSRPECYNYIKANNLGDEVKSKFNRNFTQCSTNDLIAFCEKHLKKSATPAPEVKKAEKEEAPKNDTIESTNAFYALMCCLKDKNILTSEEFDAIFNGKVVEHKVSAKMSFEEANDLFRGM